MEFEKFYAKVWETGNSFVITIPKQIIDGNDWKVGQELVVRLTPKEVIEEKETIKE